MLYPGDGVDATRHRLSNDIQVLRLHRGHNILLSRHRVGLSDPTHPMKNL